MAPKKTIQINPDFLKPRSRRGSRRARRKKPDRVASLKPNDIKKKLMQRIKDFQSREKEKAKEPEEKFTRDFKTSLNFLQDVVRRKKAKKQRRRRTRKRNGDAGGGKVAAKADASDGGPAAPLPPPVATPAPPLPAQGSAARPAPPYSNLKGGKKPTYSEYSKTLKRGSRGEEEEGEEKGRVTIHAPPAQPPSAQVQTRKGKLEAAKDHYSQSVPHPPRSNRRGARRRRKTKTIKIFRLGKSAGRVGVLVKCKATRKKVQRECDRLKKTSVLDIKKYLRRHNLIKAGSTAPEDVLRKLYEDSRLSGDIYNRNADYLLHNFLSKEG